ncbi:hypothetical protein [Oscillibacter sp.]|uniref:hypothetical protein n=1 Tax=Oscillibacter sp. TaxID=1945593 RepID=UPI002601C714|nr:hypothetical protein [Oscillibacter sp.]MDD3347406.1 hypothetical protein [Oscillibacter sp.]
MKISRNDLKMLLVLAGLVVFLALYFGIFLPFQEKTETVNAAISQLEPQLAELEDYNRDLATYEQGVKDYRRTIKNELAFYPADVKDEDFLVYLLDMEKKIGFTMESVTFDAPGMLLQFPCVVEQDGADEIADLTAYRIGAVMTGQLSYPQLKQCIRYLYESPTRTALDTVSVSYNAETGLLSGSFNISKYYLTWDSAKYMPAALPGSGKGVSDLFGTT